MPGVVTHDFTVWDAADAITNWGTLGTWATAPLINADMKCQGSNAVVGRVTAATGPVTQEGFVLASHAAANLSGGAHVFVWLKNITWPGTDTIANGGLRICISSDLTLALTGTAPNDGPTNSKNWFVGGKDTETTLGWACYAINPMATPTLTLGTPNVSGLQRIGLGARITSIIGAGSFKPANLMIDIVRYGTGLIISEGASGTPVTFADIYAADSDINNAYGVLTKQAGIYYGVGKMNFGTTGQSLVTYFADSNQVLVYQDFPVAIGFHEIKMAGAASYVTTFRLGTYSSGLTSGGVLIRGAGAAVWTLTADGANTVTKLYGSTFARMRRAAFNSSSEMRGCTFDTFGEVEANGAIIQDCIFQNVQTGAPINGTWALIIDAPAEMKSGETVYIQNNKFINCNKAIKLASTSADTYAFVGLKFSGNAYDVELFHTTGQVIINVTAGGDTPTVLYSGGGNGTYVVNNPKTLTLTGLIANSEVRIYTHGTTDELAGVENSGTTFDYPYNYVAATYVDIVVHKADRIYYRIENYLLANADASLPVTQQFDRQYSNP